MNNLKSIDISKYSPRRS